MIASGFSKRCADAKATVASDLRISEESATAVRRCAWSECTESTAS